MTISWDDVYEKRSDDFRNYPNEELLRYLGRNFLNKFPIADRHNVKILEIGCGNAANLWAVAKEGFNAYGLDASKEAIKLAKRTLSKWEVSAELEVSDVKNIPYSDHSFDSVFDVLALACVTYSELIVAYREIYRVLKPNGSFFSFHFGIDSWDYIHGGGNLVDKDTFDNFTNPGAIFPNIGLTNMLEISAAENLLTEVGFNNICIETVCKTYCNQTKSVQYLSIECKK